MSFANKMLLRFEDAAAQAAITSGMRRVSIDDALKDPAYNPTQREWSAEEVQAIKDAVKPYDLALDEAILEANRQRFVTMRDRVLSGNFKTAPPDDEGQAYGEELKRAREAYEARTGVSEGHNVIVGSAPGNVILTFTRGDPDGYVETWDRIREAQAERRSVIREAIAAMGR